MENTRNLPFSDEELLKPVNAILESLRPKLQLDGGDMSFIGVYDGVVYIRLEGACKGCSMSANTLKNLIQSNLTKSIHPNIELQNVTEDMTLPSNIERPQNETSNEVCYK